MVQERWTSRYLLATLSLVKVRWPVWTTRDTLLASTIPRLGVILKHFCTKQANEKFDL
jgi:hypothetical protein